MSDRPQDTDPVLTRLLGQLPKDIEPKADLWPGIAEAISGERRSDDARPYDPTLQHSIDTAIFDRLSPEIEPAVDLWPGIEARMRGRRRRFSRPAGLVRSQYWLLAACLAVIAIAGALLVPGPEGTDGPMTGPDVTSSRPGGQGVPAIDSVPSDLLFPETRDPYAEEIQDTLREHIVAVRSERMRIEASLDRYPADPALRQLWQSTYAQELKLIDTAERVLSTI